MIGIQRDSVLEATLWKPTRRLSKFVTGISSRSVALAQNNCYSKIQFTYDDVEHEYPAAASLALFEDLWYTLEELDQAVNEEVEALLLRKKQESHRRQSASHETGNKNESRKKSPREEFETRGLEFYLHSDTKHRSQTIRRYIQTMIQKTHQHGKFSTQKLLHTHGKHAFAYDDNNGSVIRYSLQATGSAKKRALRLAKMDESEARRLYLEDEEENISPIGKMVAVEASLH